jgi:hypothetical protein
MKTNAALFALTGLLVCGLASSGCEATVREEPVTTSAVVEVGPPYEHVRAAPLVVYEGRPVYWYNSHWYFRDGGGRWGYYHAEPYALRGRRYVIR